MVGIAVAMTAGYILLPVTRKILIRYQLAGVLGGLLIYALVVWGHQNLATETQKSLAQPNHSSQTEKSPPPTTGKNVVNRTAVSSGVIVLVLSLVLSISSLVFARHELGISQMAQEQTPLMDRLIPRLWQNGKVCRLYQ
jgi:hypothetical protein